jgi:hypothetical protein
MPNEPISQKPEKPKVVPISKAKLSDQKLVAEIKTGVAMLAVRIEEARKRRIQVVFDIRPNQDGKYHVKQLEITRLPDLL